MNAVLALRGVERTYHTSAGPVRAVRGVDLEVGRGELVALLGPSGSGKSTLLHLAVGWEHPDVGTVDVADSVRGRRGWAGLALVPQELGLLEELTASQNVSIAADLADRQPGDDGGGPPAAVEALADALGFGHLLDRLPSALSLGEQQRVAVARSLVAGPRLLVTDEPTAHQDERNARRVMVRLAESASAGTAVLVATHDRRIMSAADRVVELVDGRVVAG